MNPNCYSDVFRSEDSSYSPRGNFPSPSSSSAKKLKCDIKQQQVEIEVEVEEEEGDIISNLPESLVHHIFSFLDMKHAIHTCVLSKKWRYFWVSIPTLNFVYKPRSILFYEGVRPIQIFINFVNRVLMLRDNSNIHRFVITCRSASIGDPSHITVNLDTWILIAVLRNVQQLSLEVACEMTYRLPHCLVTCKSLTKLEIHYHGYEFNNWSGFPDKIYLPKLKTLYLDSIHFIDKYLNHRMLPNCPSLESLILHRCSFNRTNLDICSLKLKELVLTNCRPFNLWFNFNVPNLISFHYYNVSVTVMLTSVREKKEMCVQRMVHILKKLYNVEDLKLSAPHLEFLTGAPDLLDSTLTQFWNLRCLMLEDTCITKDFNRAVSYLLKLSPNIKTLGVGTRWKDCDFESGCWEAGLSSDSDCLMMNHLTVFELREVFGCDNEVKFIEVLLKNAKVLEKLVITYKKNIFSPDKHIRRFSFRKTVLALPRSSLSSTISFKYS